MVKKILYLIPCLLLILNADAQVKNGEKTKNQKSSLRAIELDVQDNSDVPVKSAGKEGAYSRGEIITSDIHSYANFSQAYAKNAHLDLTIDFDKKSIFGTVSYNVELISGNQVVFDTKDLKIHSVIVNGTETEVVLGKEDPLLGQSLTVPIPGGNSKVAIRYSTSPESEGLQWLDKSNSGLETPFVYSQGEAILTRSWIPIQDTPGSKLSYTANVRVGKGLTAVMAAESGTSDGDVFTFKMKNPIPPYLIALAAGNLKYESLSDICGVYALPHIIGDAANEFENTAKMIEIAENIAGPYKWGKFDMLVLPEAFPFGGMENPMLTFLTPTIIAGDRSLVSLVAHELAHSWSGNLVTNKTWNDFWLNEGITVYLERRIVESLDGAEQASMHRYNGYLDLVGTMKEMGEQSPDAHLKLDLLGRNPDDGMTDVAYEKGALFIEYLEEKAGRPVIDAMLRDYFERFSFKSIDTETFLEFLRKHVSEKVLTPEVIESWVYSAQLPVKVEKPKAYGKVDLMVDSISSNAMIRSIERLAKYSVSEWLYMLGELNKGTVEKAALSRLYAAHKQQLLSNSEIKTKWFVLCINSDFHDVDKEINRFVMSVGRRKFLVPIYRAMKGSKMSKGALKELYQSARPNYHSITRGTLDNLLGVTE